MGLVELVEAVAQPEREHMTVRALAAGEVRKGNRLRTLRKELAVGLLNGTTFLVGGAAFAMAWQGQPVLAAVFGGALLINLVTAAVIGTTVPMVLERLGQDPAVASSVFLTAVTDVVGFFFILPVTRPLARVALEQAVARRLLGGFFGRPPRGPDKPGDGDVIEGEVL